MSLFYSIKNPHLNSPPPEEGEEGGRKKETPSLILAFLLPSSLKVIHSFPQDKLFLIYYNKITVKKVEL